MTCETCDATIPVSEGRGRIRRYCTNSCRQKAYRGRRAEPAVPACMRERPRWVRWEARRRGDGFTKVPLTVDGRLASVTDPGTWTSYAEASKAGVGDGVGVVLGDGLGCIDLDHCIQDGVVAPWAAAIIAEHRQDAVLIERSVSGEGVHIFLPMEEAPGRRVRDGEISIETYSRGRYIAVTGDKI